MLPWRYYTGLVSALVLGLCAAGSAHAAELASLQGTGVPFGELPQPAAAASPAAGLPRELLQLSTSHIAHIPSLEPPPPQPHRSSAACNVSDGQWRVNLARPYYDGFACAQQLFKGEWGCANKRYGADFAWFRWHPAACSLPLLTKLLLTQALGGRRLLMVGDSIMRNMYYSVICLLRAVFGANAVELRPYEVVVPGANIRIQYYGSQFLVACSHSNHSARCLSGDLADMAEVDRKWMEMVPRFAALLLSTGHWLVPYKVTYAGQAPDRFAHFTSSLRGPREAIVRIINTTAQALEQQAYAGKVFWLSYQPKHFGVTGNWRQNLCTAGFPVDPTMASMVEMDRDMPEILAGELEALPTTKWQLLDVTTLSLLRPDAHPSDFVHTYQKVSTRADCSHWCLGGVPDTWWEVLVAQLSQATLATQAA